MGLFLSIHLLYLEHDNQPTKQRKGNDDENGSLDRNEWRQRNHSREHQKNSHDHRPRNRRLRYQVFGGGLINAIQAG